MGWASGSVLMSNIIDALLVGKVEPDTRKKIYEVLIPPFEEMDCDTLDECIGKDVAFDLAMREYDAEASMEYEFYEWYYESDVYKNTTADTDEEAKFEHYLDMWAAIWTLNSPKEDLFKHIEMLIKEQE